jgi:hypothetical protein
LRREFKTLHQCTVTVVLVATPFSDAEIVDVPEPAVVSMPFGGVPIGLTANGQDRFISEGPRSKILLSAAQTERGTVCPGGATVIEESVAFVIVRFVLVLTEPSVAVSMVVPVSTRG